MLRYFFEVVEAIGVHGVLIRMLVNGHQLLLFAPVPVSYLDGVIQVEVPGLDEQLHVVGAGRHTIPFDGLEGHSDVAASFCIK